MASVAIAHMITALLPGLASESISLDTNWGCSNPLPDQHNPCKPRIAADVYIMRILQGILSLSALVLFFVIVKRREMKTGLPAGPSPIVAIGALMRHRSVINDMRSLPVDASKADMRACLSGRRYRLGDHEDPSGNGTIYGIFCSRSQSISDASDAKYYATPTSPTGFGRYASAHRVSVGDCILALFTIGTFVVVLAYYLDTHDDGFNRFFNSNSFGPRFILTSAGTILASRWKSVEQSSMVVAPFARLARGPARPQSTLYFKPSVTPVFSTIYSLYHGYTFVASVTLVTLLAEILNVVISGVPYATAETWAQFVVSSYMALAILGLMIIEIAMLFFHRLSTVVLPRHPDTLGAVMSYLCGSHILDDFDSPGGEQTASGRNVLMCQRKMCELKRDVRRDGRMAWKLDDCVHGSCSL
ncbi:hypothetical protein LTR81_024198 [Elasticomyces elasticus]